MSNGIDNNIQKGDACGGRKSRTGKMREKLQTLIGENAKHGSRAPAGNGAAQADAGSTNQDHCAAGENIQLLREDNEQLRSIINNDSNNSSKPPSAD